MLREQLDRKSEYRKFLYRRGYLITNRSDIDIASYPFYGNWDIKPITDKLNLYVHKEQHSYIQTADGVTALLVGHAYNPFSMDISEDSLLLDCIASYKKSLNDFFDKVSELTGIHLIAIFCEDKAFFVQDCSGMQMCCYGKCNDNTYITSNCSIVEDIDAPTKNKFATDLLKSKSYKHGSKYLPGDITLYENFSRLGPNLYLKMNDNSFEIERFYPVTSHIELDETQIDVAQSIAKLVKTNVELCAKKWKKPAISLSGGVDSRTTLSSATDVYEKFYYYSFESKPQESKDAEAAHNICHELSLPHTIYKIPETISNDDDFELFKQIVTRNCSNISTPKDNEIRKYIYLSTLNDFEVELKSWASEIGRAFWERRYGIKLPKKLTSRHLSIFQTRFFAEPLLLKKSDKAYKAFMEKSKFVYPMFNYENTDIFYWEYRFGSWGTIVTTGQNIFNFEVTMPMNNRKIMDMFLWYPHNFRKSDGVNKEIIKTNNPKLLEVGNRIHNDYLNIKRLLLESVYYYYRTIFYKE